MYILSRLIGSLVVSQITKDTVHTLDMLRKVETISNDTWNGIRNSSYDVSYFNKDEKVASTTFKVGVGQIGWIYTKYHTYDNPLREEILYSIVDTMMAYKNPPETIWEAIASRDDELYQRLGFKWRKPAHHTVTGQGWSHNLASLAYKKNRDL